ncbi:MAG: fucose isomerase, partial [Chloroflexota bacterium]
MKTVYLVASGDLRLSANQSCWAAQAAMESQVMAAVEREGWKVKRAHPYDPQAKHGFIDSQKRGIEVFRNIPPEAPLIVAEAVWQYSHHVLPGLTTHRGAILTVANWSGQWPGLVGMLNLNGSLTKAGVQYSTLWSENFDDEFFITGLRKWLKTGKVKHNTSHVRAYKNE